MLRYLVPRHSTFIGVGQKLMHHIPAVDMCKAAGKPEGYEVAHEEVELHEHLALDGVFAYVGRESEEPVVMPEGLDIFLAEDSRDPRAA